MSEWFFTKGGQQQGPVTPEKLKELATSGQLHRDDLVWQDGLVDWVQAGSVKGLFPATAVSPAPASSSPSVVSGPAIQKQAATTGIGGFPKTSTKNHPVIKGVLAGIAVLFVVSLINRGCENTRDVARMSPENKQASSPAATQSNDPKWGFLDTTGRIAVDFQFDDVQPFSEGLSAAMKDGKWGYIDKKGWTVIDFQFDSAEKFSEGAAFVTKANERLCIDTKGHTLFTHSYDHCEPFSDGLAVVRTGKNAREAKYGKEAKYGVIDKSGKVVVAPSYAGIEPFSEGIAAVTIGDGYGPYGAIDKSGKVILTPKYMGITSFSDGVAVAFIGEPDPHNFGLVTPTDFGIVDRTGYFVLPLQQKKTLHLTPKGFCDGVVPFTTEGGGIGYLDTHGKVVVSPEDTEIMTQLQSFADGLAPALFRLGPRTQKTNEAMMRIGKLGYVNKTGKWAIDPQFDAGKDFSGGLAAVRLDKTWGYIDRMGKLVIPAQYEEAGNFIDGIAWVKVGTRNGFINTKGERVIPVEHADEQFKHPELHGDCVASEGLVPIKLRQEEVASIAQAVPSVVSDSGSKSESRVKSTAEGRSSAANSAPPPAEKPSTVTETPIPSSERSSGTKQETVATTVSPKRNGGKDGKSSVHPQVPRGAILVLTFEEDALRRKNDVLTEVADLSGRDLVAKIKGAVVVQGKVGNGLEVGDGRTFKVAGDFPMGKEPRTMAAWLKQTEANRSGCALFYGKVTDASGFGIYGGNVWKFVGWGKATTVSTNLQVDTDWHHHCVTYDGRDVRYYFDARMVAEQSIDLDTGPGALISGGSVNIFHGVIDEVAVFDRALSPEEIRKLCQTGETGIPLSAPTASAH